MVCPQNDTTSPVKLSTKRLLTLAYILQVIKMLIAIIVVFIICWAPILVNNVLVSFEILPFLHIGYYKHMREAFYVMAYANSCVNPIVYGFMSKNFRRTFKMALCRCLHGSQYVREWTFRRQNSTPSRASHQAYNHSTDAYEMSEYEYGTCKSDV